ncbi:MAG: hypothetical protein ACRCSN_09175 [Dermatophilaceae bacterium]
MDADLGRDEAAAPDVRIERATAAFLEVARTWLAWDGRPRLSDDGMRIYTPHKAIRRYGDHLVDHLAQVESLLAAETPRPNRWHESRVTTAADLAPFTEVDLDEATERLTRLSHTFALRLRAAGPEQWDLPRGEDWTLREIAEHVGTSWYADQVGRLN